MKQIKNIFQVVLLSSILFSCIEEDELDGVISKTLRIVTQNIDTLGVGDSETIRAIYSDENEDTSSTGFTWSSSSPSIATVDSNGLVTGITKGETTIYVSFESLTDSISLPIRDSTVFNNSLSSSGQFVNRSSYNLSGSFTLTQSGDNVVLTLNNFSDTAPDTHLYFSNNATIVTEGNPEIENVPNGNSSYTINNIGVFDFQYLVLVCEGFGKALLGNGEIN
ncbi:MAG: Ig-like domain-containing protein [Cyclobacteriaceae bacterium]